MTLDFLDLVKPYILGILRHAVGGWAVWLVNRGYLAGDAVQSFTGAAMFFGTLAFSVADKITMAAIKAEVDKISTLVPTRFNVT